MKELSASIYQFSSTYFNNELECILQECVGVYNQVISAHTIFKNDEEKIRDGFITYLKDEDYKHAHEPLDRYQFDKEVEDGSGRLDIRILPVNPYRGDNAFYSIECKRLDNKNVAGTSGLNAEYVKNGICRYVTSYYSSHNGSNAMFGFVVESMDIAQNVGHINALLSVDFYKRNKETINANPTQVLTYVDFAKGYQYSYVSRHRTVGGNEITLYHLLFDFSQNIQV